MSNLKKSKKDTVCVPCTTKQKKTCAKITKKNLLSKLSLIISVKPIKGVLSKVIDEVKDLIYWVASHIPNAKFGSGKKSMIVFLTIIVIFTINANIGLKTKIL